MAQSRPDATSQKDPANSPLWPSMVEQYLGGAPVVFDERVRVILPPVTEDQTQVPVTVDARGLPGAIDELLVIADLNPFPLTLRLEPRRAKGFLAFRQKIEQGTAIHAAARQNGQWRVGGAYLDAAGGGCSVKPRSTKSSDLSNVGEIRGRVWTGPERGSRLRFLVKHPMDNGLIANVPAFFIETIEIRDGKGDVLAKLTLSEAIAQNPVFTILTTEDEPTDTLLIRALENNGGEYRGEVARPAGREGSL